jgi:mannose-1-phosphate guanylyltransferase/mannose-6-phosphate isomerase
MIYPVILAGGVGSRLWPMSRSQFPKQCIDILASGKTMLQETVDRALSIPDVGPVSIVCNQDHRFLVSDQCKQYADKVSDIMLEPVGRNTAAAIAAAAWRIYKNDPKGVMFVLASDHIIKDINIFSDRALQAASRAELGAMVTFGIEPDYAETGYGYIKAEANEQVSKVVEFVEKPSKEIAEEYCKSGQYLWNSGMFMFRVDSLLEEMKIHCPDILTLSEKAVDNAHSDLGFLRLSEAEFSSMESISIDYAVMEKTKNAEVVRLPSIWNDVGSWSAMWDVMPSDEDGNILQGDVIAHETKNCLIKSEDRLVAVVGVEDLIIIDTSDALLIANKNNAQDVKKIVDILISKNRDEVNVHSEVFRPWGKYQSIDVGGRYQVKRITVKPGEKLSTQMHHHRAEHWVVVSGTAKVQNGKETSLLTENESTYIPIGEIHSLENPGMVSLELIEVQTGSYLGEDDIVRFDDRYGRSEQE